MVMSAFRSWIQPNIHTVFNVTGGHKLMTLALAQSMRDLADDLHIVYTETRHDRLSWLTPDPIVEPMQDVLSVDDILRTQGYRKTGDSNADGHWQVHAGERAELSRMMGDQAETFAKFFGVLNKLADFALNEDGGVFRPLQRLEYAPGGQQAQLLRQAAKLTLLDWEDDSLVFRSEDSARYFRGGWLEEYVWLKLRGIKPTDFAINAEVLPFGSETRNELDALIAHRNRLLVIECKTSGFGANQERDVSYVYKLSQIGSQIGGIMCKKLLLCARPVHEEIRQRAREYQIDILAASEVKNLVEYIKGWMAP